MTAADGIGITATGIAGATLTSADLSRARVFYIVRLGFPLILDEPDRFAFSAGGCVITVCRTGDDRAATDLERLPQRRVGVIALRCTGAEVRRVADALTAAGIEHSGVKVDPRLATEQVAFEDPDGNGWELRVC